METDWTETNKLLRALDLESYFAARNVTTKSMTRKGANICCPFCPGGDDSFHCGVFYDHKNFNCFKCHETGGLFKLCSQMFGMPYDEFIDSIRGKTTNRQDAAETIRSMFDKPVAYTKVELKQIELPKEAIPITQTTCGYWKVLRDFLHKRKIDLYACKQYNVHFCPYGDFANRLILPIYMNKTLVNFQARDVTDCDRAPKYLTYPGTSLGNMLYGYDTFDRDSKIMVIVEGIFDCWSLPDIGLGTFGSVFTNAQERLIFGLCEHVERLVLCMDPEVWIEPRTNQSLRKSLGLLRPYFDSVGAAKLPLGEDPDSLDTKELMECINKAEDIE